MIPPCMMVFSARLLFRASRPAVSARHEINSGWHFASVQNLAAQRPPPSSPVLLSAAYPSLVSQVRIGDALELGTILSVRDQILRHLPAARRVVITAPAESLPELAHVLAVLLDRKLRADRVSCVLTCLAEVAAEGACVPTNIQEAVEARF